MRQMLDSPNIHKPAMPKEQHSMGGAFEKLNPCSHWPWSKHAIPVLGTRKHTFGDCPKSRPNGETKQDILTEPMTPASLAPQGIWETWAGAFPHFVLGCPSQTNSRVLVNCIPCLYLGGVNNRAPVWTLVPHCLQAGLISPPAHSPCWRSMTCSGFFAMDIRCPHHCAGVHLYLLHVAGAALHKVLGCVVFSE